MEMPATRKKQVGLGGPAQYVEDPNKPSCDPAEHDTRDRKIADLLTRGIGTEWEKGFLVSIYGQIGLTRKQAITASKILRKYEADATP
jgi:hypothetical protein